MEEKELYVPWPGWRIVDDLGAGAFGQVLEIERNLAGINEKAAMKIISRPTRQELEWDYDNGYDRKSITDKYTDMLQRCISEYKVMAEMKGQSHIVSCDDLAVERHSDGIGWDIYIRMELLTPLTKVMRKRMLTESEVIRLGKDICQALILCESKNIIHRDIKPANIMISKFGDFKLGDFGQAKILDHTTAGTQTGTPDFWAPEVKNLEKYGKEADIYSLGMVMYVLLNNRKMPFINADTIPTYDMAAAASFRRYQGEKIPAPKYGSPELKEIVLKACEFKPARRYHSAGEMYQALERVQVSGKGTTYSASDEGMGNRQNEYSGNDFDNWNAETVSVKHENNNRKARTGTVKSQSRIPPEKEQTHKKQPAPAKTSQPQKRAGRVAAEVQKKTEKKSSGGIILIILTIAAVIGIVGWNYNRGKQEVISKNTGNAADASAATEDGTNVSYYDNGNIRSEIRHDSDGNMISYISYYEDGKKESENIWNNDRTCETWTGYKEDGSISYSYEVEYDSSGKKLKQTNLGSDGTVESVDEFDENDHRVKSTHYEDENIAGWDTLEYNADGNMTKVTSYTPEGMVYRYHEYEYDSEGKETAERDYDAAGRLSSEILFDSEGKACKAYTYDENGNATEGKITYTEDGLGYSIDYSSDN